MIVVDNGSSDGSVAQLQERFGDRIDLLPLKKNRGFARGNNAGIRYALDRFDPAYIILLNNDTLAGADFPAPLIAALAADPAAGLAAPRVLDLPGRRFWQKPIVRRFGFWSYLCLATPLYHLTSRLVRLNRRQPSRVYAVPGCALCFRRAALEQIGLLDEQTFLGSEEYIVAEKLRRAGLFTYFVPDSTINHLVGRSTAQVGQTAKAGAFLRSERYLLTEYYRFGFWRRLAIRLVRLTLYAARLWPQGAFEEWLQIAGGTAI